MTKILGACLAVAALAAPSASFAYSARISVEALVAKAEIIVLAKVIDVRTATTDPHSDRIATAHITATWKGQPSGDRIDYVASPGWFACDVSDAHIGESVVLFLGRQSEDGRYHITHFGRGRMPLFDAAGALHARMHEVSVPARAKVRGQLRSFPDGIALDVLHEIVKQHTE